MSDSISTGQRSIISNRFKAHFSSKHPDLKVASNALKLALGITEQALDGMPIYGPKAAIGAVLKIIERYEKCTDNAEVLQDVKSRLDRLRTAVIDPLAQPNAVVSPELEAAVDTFVRCLDLITSGWNEKLSQNFLLRFLNAEEYEAGLIGLSHDVDGAVSCFQAASAVRQERKIDEIRDALSRNGGDARQRDERLLQSINQVNRVVRAAAGDSLDPIEAMPHATLAGYDSFAHNEIRACLPGTRVEVLRKIRTFIMNTEESQMRNYLLSGMAGLGKSTIARSICEEVDKQQDADLAASFFFSRRAADSDLRDPAIIIPTLAYRLAHYDEGFRAALKEELAKDPELPTKAIQFQADGLLARPLSKMNPRQQPALIVFDAFDECEREAIAEEVLRCILVSIAAAPCNIKLLVTSRPEAHIRAVFKKSHTHDSLILHEIEEDVVKGDICLYLQTSLRTIPSILGLDLPEDWATQEEAEVLVENAGKLFVYAATVFRLLSDRRICKPRAQLQMLMKANSGRASGLHAHLDETYMTVLRAAVPPPPEQAEVVEDIRCALGTIIHLQDTLTMGAMDALLMKDSGYTRSALNCLHSVVLVPESDDRSPRLYHQSFPDFLLDPQRCFDNQFLIKAEDHHTNLSLHCLNLLNQYLGRDMAGIEDLLLPHSEIEDFDRKVAMAVPPQLAYACRFWAEHLANSRRGDQDVTQSLLTFVFKNILYWVECMSLLGSVEAAIRSAQMALQWVEESKAPTGATAILQDAARFLQAYSEPIRRCASHVHRTGLIFTPSETMLFTNFKYESRGSRIILGGAQSWPACLAVWSMSSAVLCISFSPNGARLAVAGNERSVRICNSFTGETTSVLRGHSDLVLSVAFSPDGSCIAFGSKDRTVRVWDIQSSKELVILRSHFDWVRSVAFSSDSTHIASGSDDQTARVWNAQSEKESAILWDHSGCVWSVAFSANGNRIASGSRDKTVRVWNVQSGKQLAILHGHSDSVWSVAFSPDGSRIASGSEDKTVRVWAAQSNKQLVVLRGHSRGVLSVAFSPDDTRIASGSQDCTVRVWDPQSGKQLAILHGHSSFVRSVVFSPDGSRIASGSHDGTVRVWDAQWGKRLAALDADSDSVSSVTFSPDETSIIVNGKKAQKLFGPSTRVLHPVTGSTPPSTFTGELSFDPSTRWIIEQSSRKHVLFIPRSYEIETEVSFSSNGGLAAFGTKDGEVVVIQF